MKILLDECLDRRLAKEIVGYKIKTVPYNELGWHKKRRAYAAG